MSGALGVKLGLSLDLDRGEAKAMQLVVCELLFGKLAELSLALYILLRNIAATPGSASFFCNPLVANTHRCLVVADAHTGPLGWVQHLGASTPLHSTTTRKTLYSCGKELDTDDTDAARYVAWNSDVAVVCENTRSDFTAADLRRVARIAQDSLDAMREHVEQAMDCTN